MCNSTYICHCIFVSIDKGHSFDALLLYGHEFSLTIFDILVFSFVDLMVQDYLVAAIIAYFVGKVIRIPLQILLHMLLYKIYTFGHVLNPHTLVCFSSKILIFIRSVGGRSNLARKTLIDKRFLI